MKRILAILLCAGLLIGVCPMAATAASASDEKLFELADDATTAIFMLSGHVPEGDRYSAESVFNYIMWKGDYSAYGVGEPIVYEDISYYDLYKVPAAAYEQEVARFFVLSDELVTELRALQMDGYNQQTQQMEKVPVYNAAENCYEFGAGGGIGDSRINYAYGYIQNGTRYDFYFYRAEMDYQWTKDAVQGTDCLFCKSYDGMVCAYGIAGYVHYVMDYDGTNLRFVWSEDIEALPAGTNVVLRETVTAQIEGDGAFCRAADGRSLQLCGYDGTGDTFVVPATVQGHPVSTVGPWIFNGESVPSRLVLPSSIEKLADYVIDSTQTTDVVYIGTAADWANVEKAENWFGYTDEELTVTFAPSLSDAASGIQVFRSDGTAFDSAFTLTAKSVTDEKTLQLLQDYDHAAVLDITMLKDSAETQPDGKVTVRVPVPEGADGSCCGVFLLGEDGSITDMNARFENNMMVFETDHFSLYAVAEYPTLKGDADGDGKITTTDARLALQFTADKITADKLDATAADVDGDSKVTTTDARMILQYSAGKITNFT